MFDILEGAQVLEWLPGLMLVCVRGRIPIELVEVERGLVLRQTQLAISGRASPAWTESAVDLARLPCAQGIQRPTAQATLEQAQIVLRAHVRLMRMYPRLIWDAILRHHPDYVATPHAQVVCDVADLTCQVQVHQAGAVLATFELTDPRLVRASLVLTWIAPEERWRPYLNRRRTESLFRVPEPLSSGHARMAHQAQIADDLSDLERDILPVLAG